MDSLGDGPIPLGVQPGRDPVTAWHDALRASREDTGRREAQILRLWVEVRASCRRR